jgi:hypothetical protein
MRILLLALLIPFIVSCNQNKSSKNYAEDLFELGVKQGELHLQINEASGMVASIHNPGMLWTHNDSGDLPRIFLIDASGKIQSIVMLASAKNRDWEDVAIGTGPVTGKTYLYVGDIGDNDGIYASKKIYRFEEPTIPVGVRDTIIRQIDSIEFVMEDGARDSEALFVDPLTNDIYVFSKRERSIGLYRLKYPQLTNAVDTAKLITRMPYRQVVAADISRSGEEILLKTYDSIYYWKRSLNESIPDLLTKVSTPLPYVSEPQGESIAFDYAGNGYFTVSEVAKGERAIVYYYKRKKKE